MLPLLHPRPIHLIVGKYSNKYINVSVEHPTVDTTKLVIPETQTEKKLKETKTSIDETKKNITTLKKIWGTK